MGRAKGAGGPRVVETDPTSLFGGVTLRGVQKEQSQGGGKPLRVRALRVLSHRARSSLSSSHPRRFY